MELVDRLRAWSYRRQHLGRATSPALEVLRDVIGVYSTHPTAPLAVLARTATMTPAEFRALEANRSVVRIVAMRGSTFMVPADNAARVFAATRAGAEQMVSLMRARGLDVATYERLTPLVLECCSEPVTPSQLRARTKSQEDVYMVARVLARDGRILRVGASLRADQLKYVATRAWLGSEFEQIDRAEAQAWLAAEYLRAFGPARVADFAWWAGATRRAAVAALASVATIERDGLLLRAEDVHDFDRSSRLGPDTLAVLPKWDSYTMGFAPDGRQRFIDDQYLKLAYTSVTGSPGATSGDGLPLILRGGRAIATWSHRFEGQRMTITVSPFEGARVPDSAFEAVGQLLSASTLTLRTAEPAAR